MEDRSQETGDTSQEAVASDVAVDATASDAAQPSRDREGAVADGAAGREPFGAQTELPSTADAELRAAVEAIVYVTEEPVSAAQIAAVVKRPEAEVKTVLEALVAACAAPDRGIAVREIAGGYKMATKPEHHEILGAFARSLKPPLKLSLAALETLATIAYKQPITAPEIMEIRGVQGAGVLKTLLDRKLIQTSGRKAVVGRPILYKTTKEFLVQFGLKDLSELPTLKEFEELRRMAVDGEEEGGSAEAEGGSSEPQAQPTAVQDAHEEVGGCSPPDGQIEAAAPEPQPAPESAGDAGRAEDDAPETETTHS